MASSHEIDRAQQVAHVRVWGPTAASSGLRAIDDLAEDPNFEWHYDVLVDIRDLDDGDAPLEDLEEVAASLRQLREKFQGRIAVVCQVGTQFDLLNLMSGFAVAIGLRIQPFTDSARALDWLAEEPA